MANAPAETTEQLIARLQNENKALKANQPKPRKVEIRLSAKKAISVYGLNARFPVTLYKQQMEKLLGMADEIRAFIKTHDGELAVKGVDESASPTES